MQITLIGYKGNSVNLFPALGKELAKKISGVTLQQRFAPLPEDLPVVAMEASNDADFIFVFAQLEDEGEADFLKRKLIDVELATKTRILKAIDVDDVSSTDQDSFNERKQELIQTYSKLIIDILFNEAGFEPKEKELYE